MANRRELIEELVRLRRREDEIIKQLMLEDSVSGTFKEVSDESLADLEEKDLKVKVTRILQELAIPANVKGYNYTRTAILMAIEDQELVHLVTKSLYPQVAKEHKTTPSRVERAIRHAIEVSWTRGEAEAYEKLFGYSSKTKDVKPTNSEFIAVIVDKMLLQ